jgi:hypothetical protein
MADEGFKLPGASLEELEKIIEAFSQKNTPASNDDVAQLVGSSTSTISRCNAFFVDVGLLQGGQKKEATELGRKLGLALHHAQTPEVQRFWTEVVASHPFLSEQVTSVRVQKAVPKAELPSKILYNSKSKKNKYTEIGSRTVTDILLRAGVVAEDDGNLVVPRGAPTPAASVEAKADSGGAVASGVKEPDKKNTQPPPDAPTIQLAINLQIQIQEFEDTSKYEDLFRALRKHLMESPPSEQ